jgi:oligopeptide transport system permease protein
VTAFALRRLGLMIPTLWVIASVSFALVRLAPGGPFQSERDIPPAAHAALLAKYGLDRPLHEQYLTFLARAAVLDLGPSYSQPAREVRDLVLSSAGVSFELGAWALAMAVLVGIPLGAWAAYRHDTAVDRLASATALVGVSIPNFVLGPLLVLLFSLTLYWLPPALWSGPESRVLPVATLAAVYVAYVARLTRGGMLETLRQDYVRTARAKGLDERRVVVRHGLRLGILPVVSFLGPAAARLVTGSLAVEQIFAVPGLGRHLVNGAVNRDYTLVLGVVLFYAGVLLVLNLLVDLAYAWLDPRVELA